MTTFTTIPVITWSTSANSIKMEVECFTRELLNDNVRYMVAHDYRFSVDYREVDVRSLNV